MTKTDNNVTRKKTSNRKDSASESPAVKAPPVKGKPKNAASEPDCEQRMTGDNKLGRPPEPVPPQKAEEIIDWISHGKPLRVFCRIEGNPSWRAVYHWLEKDESFAARFARARDMGADAIAEEALEIIDSEPEMATSATGSHRDSAHTTWLKNRAEMRLKLLAKWNPKKYGDKLDMNHGVQPDNPMASLIQRLAGTGLPVVKDDEKAEQ